MPLSQSLSALESGGDGTDTWLGIPRGQGNFLAITIGGLKPWILISTASDLLDDLEHINDLL